MRAGTYYYYMYSLRVLGSEAISATAMHARAQTIWFMFYGPAAAAVTWNFGPRSRVCWSMAHQNETYVR